MRSQIFLVAALLSTTSFVSTSSTVAQSSAAPIDQLNDKLAGVLRLLDSCEETLRVVQAVPPVGEQAAVKAKLNEIKTGLGDASDKFENVLSTVASTKLASPTKSNVASSSSITTAPSVVSTTTISKAASAPVSTMNASSTLGSSPSGSSVSTSDDDNDFDEIQIPSNAALSGSKRVHETIVSPPQAVIDEAAKKARAGEKPAFNATAASASGVVIDMTRSEPGSRSPPSKTISTASLASKLTTDIVSARLSNYLNQMKSTAATNTSASNTSAAVLSAKSVNPAANTKAAPVTSAPVNSSQAQSAPVNSAQIQRSPVNSVTLSKTSAFTLNTSAPNASTVSLSTTAAAPNTSTSAPTLDDVASLMFKGEFSPFARALNPFVKSRVCLNPTSNGQTLFEIAVRNGASQAILNYLLGAQCYVAQFTDNETALEVAIKKDNLELLKAMLKISGFANEFKGDLPRLFGLASLHGSEELNDFMALQL